MTSAIDPTKSKVKSTSVGGASAKAPAKKAEKAEKTEKTAPVAAQPETSFGAQARSNALVPQAPEPGAGLEHAGSLDLGGSVATREPEILDATVFPNMMRDVVGYVKEVSPGRARHEFGRALKAVEDGRELVVKNYSLLHASLQDMFKKVQDACQKPGSSLTIPGASRPLVPGEGAEVKIEE